jgi:hypothetical protein
MALWHILRFFVLARKIWQPWSQVCVGQLHFYAGFIFCPARLENPFTLEELHNYA